MYVLQTGAEAILLKVMPFFQIHILSEFFQSLHILVGCDRCAIVLHPKLLPVFLVGLPNRLGNLHRKKIEFFLKLRYVS